MTPTRGYTIKRIYNRTYTKAISRFMYYAIDKTNKAYGDKFPNWEHFDMRKHLDSPKFQLFVAFKNGIPCGFMISTLVNSMFDSSVIILKQQLLYAVPGTKASYYLLKEFIDFGKRNANHVITSIGAKTNIKGRSLERLGFKKLEEHYRMEF